MNENILDVTMAPECPHKNCGQIFNESNLRLAIYLNGIFFLIKPEKGIIGFTCPRCQRTVTNSASYNDILKIKDRLSNSLIEVVSYSESENGKMLVYPKSSFEPTLNYLSPFMLNSEVINELNIDYFRSSNENDTVLSDQIINHVEKNPELKDKYCSFAGDANSPISTFRAVYWFDEKNIGNCLSYEAEHHVRIFPRYHYRTELVKQIHSLLGINYFMGKTFEQAKVDHEKENTQLIETLTTYAREHNLNVEKLLEDNNINESFALIDIIEQNQDWIANDPIIPAQFLKILTLGPDPLGNLTADTCNYLWSEINPFENRAFPEFFVDEIDDPDLGLQIHNKNEKHITMAKLVQKTATKQYTQEFLRDNLVDFLEEYENLIQGNEFSYADIWQLKESYLEGLHEVIKKGLPQEESFVFRFEGPGWLIKFNEEWLPGLRDKGLKYIYFLLCNKNIRFSYLDLEKVDGVNPGLYLGYELEARQESDEDQKKGKPFDVDEIMDDAGFDDMRKKRKELKKTIEDAEDNNDILRAENARRELEDFDTHYQDYWIPRQQKKKTFVDKNIKDARRKVEISIERAIEKIKGYDPALYSHFIESIHGLPKICYKNAKVKQLYLPDYQVMYQPDPDVDWHLE